MAPETFLFGLIKNLRLSRASVVVFLSRDSARSRPGAIFRDYPSVLIRVLVAVEFDTARWKCAIFPCPRLPGIFISPIWSVLFKMNSFLLSSFNASISMEIVARGIPELCQRLKCWWAIYRKRFGSTVIHKTIVNSNYITFDLNYKKKRFVFVCDFWLVASKSFLIRDWFEWLKNNSNIKFSRPFIIQVCNVCKYISEKLNHLNLL